MQKTKNPRVFLIDNINDDIRDLVNGRDYIGITIHHSDFTPDRQQVFEIDSWHLERFGPKGLGYAFVVEKDGTIYAGGRLVNHESQAHCLGTVDLAGKKVKINDKYLGICFAGNGVLQDMTMGQRVSGYNLIHHLAKYTGVEIHGIHTHAVLQGNKSCPGYLFEKWIPHFHDALEEGVKMR